MPGVAPHSDPKPPSTPNGGAWTLKPDGSWSWTSGATPDPGLVSQWGYEATTDIRRDPSGKPNHGAWVQGGNRGGPGGLVWEWGATPDPSLVSTYGAGAVTDPDKVPGTGLSTTGDPAHPPPPDVVPPTVADAWGGVAPNVTGTVPPASDGSGTVSQPPSHPPYVVSPGGIRNAENVLLSEIDSEIGTYNDLKAYVAQAQGQNLYSDPGVREQLVNAQDQLLAQGGDMITMAGRFTSMLNQAAQNYAHADLGSFVPQS